MSLLLLRSRPSPPPPPPPPPVPSLLFPSFPFFLPRPRSRSHFLFSPRTAAFSPSPILTRPFRHRLPVASALPISDQELLRVLTASFDTGDAAGAHLPAVRSYESDIACLTLIGAVFSDQAITAAAADGGDAANEHLSSGASTMVVETVFPGNPGGDCTVSTRLFLPAKEVKAKAKKLRSSLTADMLSSNPTVSKNILSMTFRQVVLQQIWSFKLSLFSPGTQRKIEDLANPREAPADFSVSSSDVRILSTLAEAICFCALDEAEKKYLWSVGGFHSNYGLQWFQKPKRYCSVDSSMCVYRVSEHEVLNNATKLVERTSVPKGRSSDGEPKLKHSWRVAHDSSRLKNDKVRGNASWPDDFTPAYRLEINVNNFEDVKFEGWKELDDNRWEALLTHFQMVELANILDMYYEDRYTLPDKQLSCGLITNTNKITRNKNSLPKMVFVTLVGACIFLVVSILAQACWPHLVKAKRVSGRNYAAFSTELESCNLHFDETDKLEVLCALVVGKIKDSLGWPGDVIVDASGSAWIGELPNYLRNKDLPIHADSVDELAISRTNEDAQHHAATSVSGASSLETNGVDTQATAQDIASFQVVMSSDGKIVGFQPTSRVAVNHWASSPLAKELYEGQKLSPGFLEPRVKIPLPRDVYLLELLISVNPETSFALARSVKQSN